jgi:hypothetical protein
MLVILVQGRVNSHFNLLVDIGTIARSMESRVNLLATGKLVQINLLLAKGACVEAALLDLDSVSVVFVLAFVNAHFTFL